MEQRLANNCGSSMQVGELFLACRREALNELRAVVFVAAIIESRGHGEKFLPAWLNMIRTGTSNMAAL